tara:strand:+ start:570 stop:761 length:192 start_codon:yes stop_codon:yes gene_type:complete
MKYRIITTTKTIIAQIDIFFRNTFKFEFDEIKPGSTNIKTKISAIAGIICSKFINKIFVYLLV